MSQLMLEDPPLLRDSLRYNTGTTTISNTCGCICTTYPCSCQFVTIGSTEYVPAPKYSNRHERRKAYVLERRGVG